ncbi:succinyl-CoA synthetase subunit alpha (plasmid) [Antarctobacter heliothermus]|uniref:Succinyl-CoA synthetase subunit alpha n=1 Tax=Antarctobacter heliothermus TaxID=74033 RepID=A0A222EBA6_9RHOB|nr:acetate--CoA ligase family protein [Antarctobacter heliothermus]ASP23479.1 succinyl-CoA synthetase subunit alpha [Antarctobacter heliothermus]
MTELTNPVMPGLAPGLDGFFSPRSIAVVGASENSYWGRNVFRNLTATGFAGRVVPVNPKRETVFGLPCIRTLRDLTEPVDLVYIAAPTDAVPGVLEDAASVGIRHAVIIAAGFGEAGDHERQSELTKFAAAHGITVLGPNCPGFVNVSDGVSAYGQDIPAGTKAGPVAVVLQSGALATVMFKFARAHGIGLSKLICMGNEAVTDTSDVVEYLIADKDTRVIALFVEQFRDGARFLDLARRALLAGKAIVVLKAGRTEAGQRSALAHTGAVAGDEAVANAALKQAGVARVRSIEELIITAGLFASGVQLKGRRMAAVTASGGACDIIADRASDEGIDMPEFSPETQQALRDYLPGFATVQNPLDTAAVDTARKTGTAAVPMDVVAEIVSRDPGIDFVFYLGFNVVPQFEPEPTEAKKQTARMAHVRDMMDSAPVPVCPVSLSCLEVGPFARTLFETNGIFILGGIDLGLTAIGHAIRWNTARDAARAVGTFAAPQTGPYLTEGRDGPWSEHAGRAVLEASGVPLVPAVLVHSSDEAVAAAEQLGYPVVLKICAAEIAHKSDIGGVALNLATPEAVRSAYESVAQAGRTAACTSVEGVLVSPMRPRGVELYAGITVDPTFGPTLATGLGGIWIETFKDVGLRVLPCTTSDVEDMLRSLRASPLLDGARGGPRVDIPAAARAIHAVAQAALSLGPDLRALEVNPLWCLDDKVEALDALVITGR